jgi:hypothetical protein
MDTIETLKEEIINQVLELLRDSQPQEDYNTKTLATVLGRSSEEISRTAEQYHGHYMDGRYHKFVRIEIDYRRKMGLNLIKGKEK